MTDAYPVDPRRGGSEESEPTGPRVTDKRRLDPVTGALRQPPSESEPEPRAGHPKVAAEARGSLPDGGVPGKEADAAEVLDDEVPVEVPDFPSEVAADVGAEVRGGDPVHPDTTLAADLTRDLQRLQAEYVNYKKRVDRDREMHRTLATGSVVEALLPVLDDINLARQHGDLEGSPFAAIADKLDGTLTKIGVERFGQPGDPFDPAVHEALMHVEAELAVGTIGTTVVQVLQPGYRMGQRIIRAARVAVADPQA